MTQTNLEQSEQQRIHCGLSRAQWEEALEHGSPAKLVAKYNRYIEHLTKRIDREFMRPKYVLGFASTKYISVSQLAEALNVGEFHLTNMRRRHKLEGTKYDRLVIYSQEQLSRFLTDASQAENRKSALAAAFLRWLDSQD